MKLTVITLLHMKRYTLFTLMVVCGIVGSIAGTENIRWEKIGTQMREIGADSVKPVSPLEYYRLRSWVRASGKERLFAEISTSKFTMDADAPDIEVSEAMLERFLDEWVDGIVTYGDSVAAVITHNEGDDYVLLNHCWIEDGRWVNAGQGIAEDVESALHKLNTDLPLNHANLPRIELIKNIPDDVTPFVRFLSGVKSSPEQFLLDMIASHKLVINGEIHRRKVSWDMLKRLIALPNFPKVAGHVFLELPSWCQPIMNKFMASDTLDTEAILRIFREEQLNGWWDRGEYEFICELWKLNRKLSDDERIKVVLTDYQLPYSQITRREELSLAEDRNTHMADVITETITTSTDSRNSLFLVGMAHAYKSRQAGIASSADGMQNAMTAGAQLAQRLGNENVFTVYQHIFTGSNAREYIAPARGGIFDLAFERNGNRPVGFRLAGSPFGSEPFDGVTEIKYNMATGSYADNYDGMLFLHPLTTEPKAAPLTEVFTDEFVNEMKRRAEYINNGDNPAYWFGRKASDLTREYIIKRLQSE